MRKLLLVLPLFLSLAAALLLTPIPTPAPLNAAPTSIDLTLTGQAIPLITTFAKDQAADAIPALAHLNAFKVTTATTPDGKPLPDLKNKYLYLLPLKAADPLLNTKDAAGKYFELKAKLFKAESALLITQATPTKAPANDFQSLRPTTLTGKAVF